MSTQRGTHAGPMVLPPHNPATREVETRWPHGRDPRVPTPLREHAEDYWGEDHPPQVAGDTVFDRTGPCGGQRHLFDIIESTIWREIELPSGEYVERAEFRAVLTCVRCGDVTQWDGTRTEQRRTSVQVAPLVAGVLVAQHVDGTASDGWSGDHRSYNIYRDGSLVGRIEWGITGRGRRYHTAMLTDGPSAEAPDPEAALRKLARAIKSSSPAEQPVGASS